MEDLARHHAPLTDLFPTFGSSDAVDAWRLSEQQIEFYHENGYLAGVPLLDQRQVDFLREELESFFQEDHPGRELWHEYHSNESTDQNTVLFHALGAWRIKPGFHDALWNPRFLVPASQLLGGAVRFWHDQLFCKPARHGGVVAWHQDYSYWTRTKPLQHLTCWIGLDDSTIDNGCLHYVPGSHRWQLLPATELGGAMDGLETVLSEQQMRAFRDPVAVELKAGECSFHHPLLVHGSFENRTDHPRRALVLNVCRDGTQSATDEPLLQGVPVIPRGEELSGDFFPLLYDPGES